MREEGRFLKKIVIDPGHGGWDAGAIAVDGVPEKQFNLELGLALREELKRYECVVLMTRESDMAVAPGSEGNPAAELHARAEIANRVEADLLLSLHHDSSASPQVRGASLYIWTDREGWLPAEGNHKAPRSYALARKFYPIAQEALAAFGIPWRGEIMCADFQVLRDAHLPAMLLECFDGASEEDVRIAREPEFVPALAAALARGIAEALELPERVLSSQWDPVREIAIAKQTGLIDTEHQPNAPVTWGQFATVLNRLVQRMNRIR